jgi:CheY-like chemotaxis protein
MDSEKKETILFVDDEEGILSVSSEYFQRKGYQTLTARTGPEALKILAGQTIDCCFTDINMRTCRKNSKPRQYHAGDRYDRLSFSGKRHPDD